MDATAEDQPPDGSLSATYRGPMSDALATANDQVQRGGFLVSPSTWNHAVHTARGPLLAKIQHAKQAMAANDQGQAGTTSVPHVPMGLSGACSHLLGRRPGGVQSAHLVAALDPDSVVDMGSSSGAASVPVQDGHGSNASGTDALWRSVFSAMAALAHAGTRAPPDVLAQTAGFMQLKAKECMSAAEEQDGLLGGAPESGSDSDDGSDGEGGEGPGGGRRAAMNAAADAVEAVVEVFAEAHVAVPVVPVYSSMGVACDPVRELLSRESVLAVEEVAAQKYGGATAEAGAVRMSVGQGLQVCADSLPADVINFVGRVVALAPNAALVARNAMQAGPRLMMGRRGGGPLMRQMAAVNVSELLDKSWEMELQTKLGQHGWAKVKWADR